MNSKTQRRRLASVRVGGARKKNHYTGCVMENRATVEGEHSWSDR